MSTGDTPGFEPAVVEAIVRHMNDDHPDDTLLIVRALGGRPSATTAAMVGFDGEGGDYLATVAGAEKVVRVPWSRRISERAEVRAEVVALYERACTALGVEQRPH
jgi:hypothetical protein